MNIRHAFCLAGVAVAGCLIACHRAPAQTELGAPLCATQEGIEEQISMRVRIDGPGSFHAMPDDSVVVVVDGVERWRGVYAAFVAPRTFGVDTEAWEIPQSADSVQGLLLLKGDSARVLYCVGGRRPLAWIIRTRRVP